MKRVILILALAGLAVSCDNDEQKISATNLPTQAQDFIAEYFGEAQIQRVYKSTEADDYDNRYTAYMKNGIEIDFDENGAWTDIDSERLNVPVPDNLLQGETPKIRQYIAENYIGQNVVNLDREPYGYDVELGNRTDLRFDTAQNFLGIDY